MQCIEIATNHRKSEYDKVSAEYESWKAKGLKLNMARGKPSKQQLDLVSGILTALTSAEECVYIDHPDSLTGSPEAIGV